MWRKTDSAVVFKLSLIALALISSFYIFYGSVHLLVHYHGGVDLEGRVIEQQYVYRGVYPALANPENGYPRAHLIVPYVDRELDISFFEGIKNNFEGVTAKQGRKTYSTGYLPWSYFNATLFFPPFVSQWEWANIKWYFWALNLLCLLLTALLVYQKTKAMGVQWALVAAFLPIANVATHLNLKNGNYAIIVVFCLFLFLHCIERKNQFGAFLAICLALIKPNISMLFVLITLVRRQFVLAAGIVIYLIVATLVISNVTQSSVYSMFEAFFDNFADFAQKRTDLMLYVESIVAQFGFAEHYLDTLVYLLLFISACLSYAFIVLVSRFKIDNLTLFAGIAVISRVGMYHRNYDDSMLVFLLLALFYLFHKTRHHIDFLCFILVGLTLWLPIGEYASKEVKSIKVIIWLASMAWLFFRHWQGTKIDDKSQNTA